MEFYVDVLCVDPVVEDSGESFGLLDSFTTFEAAKAAAERFTPPTGHDVEGAVITAWGTPTEVNGTYDAGWSWPDPPAGWSA